MNNNNTNLETIWKLNAKEQETPEQRDARLHHDRERKHQKHEQESVSKRQERLSSLRERRKGKNKMETTRDRELRLARENKRKCKLKVRNKILRSIRSDLTK
jgi:hypothetical protein